MSPVAGQAADMTDTPSASGPGSSAPGSTGPGASPGDHDEVTVARPGSSADAPVMEGAQELRDDAAQARAEDVESRAEPAEGLSPSAQQATQTAGLPEAAGDDQRTGDA